MTVKQLLLRNYGDLRLENVASQNVHADQVKIQTQYAGVSFTDIIIQRGWYRYQKEHMPLPYVPGFEATGIVTEVGQGVTDIAVGNKVVVLQKSGCFSEEIIASKDTVMTLPETTDLQWAATLPVNYFTAYHALNNLVRIFPNSNILVESAAGGVGDMLVQLASRGHQITGVVGTRSKFQYVQKLGATNVYTCGNIPNNLRFDVIFCASGKNIKNFQKLLTKNGKLIVYGFHSLVPTTRWISVEIILRYLSLPKIHIFDLVYKNQTVAGFNIIHLDPLSKECISAKKALLNELKREKLNKHTVSCFPVTQYKDAFELVENREHLGKVLLEF